ncbi:hypothetical protein BDZ94DRAFT_1227258 [Collybia nuda]|uniref:Uncharacterized protein n=1 Tax=Collybia nuda TaxID=64659 RepID=A0A9P5XUC9_9AGAR|nr:hypothetical protein BDZ94DRAFT_1227258 [Collybia nuda]
MPAYSSSLPILTLVANDPDQSRRERSIDRTILLDIAPDRETLILSEKSTKYLRQTLKIRVASTNAVHWLYRNRKSTNTDVQGATSRMSTFVPRDTHDDMRENAGQNLHVVRRRVLSASSVSPLCLPMTSIENRLASAEGGLSLDIWSSMTLSTADKLISPRPLGPTHILIAHNALPKTNFESLPENRPLRRKKSSTLIFPKVLELPINDLLFALNVPNLSPTIPALPRRLFKELPRVFMFVPHLETFAELVVYLHTKNQAELFRKLVPEWMRDIMHPLPTAGSAVSMAESRGVGCRAGRFFGMLVSGSASDSSLDQDRPVSGEPERSIDFIAREVAEAECSLALPGSSADPLFKTTSRLDALRDNLDYIGYFGRDVWNELETCREILVRAVSWKAKVEGCMEKDH